METDQSPRVTALGPGEAWTQLMRQLSACGRQLRRHLADAASQHGLTDTELLLVACCDDEQANMSQNDLAAAVGLSAAQVSGLVDKLRQQGWLAVRRSRLDRRRMQWQVTDPGRQLLRQVWSSLAPHAEAWDAAVGAGDRQQLAQMLTRLLGAVRWQPSAGDELQDGAKTLPVPGKEAA